MFNRYRKSISSLIATVAGWGLAASADSVYTAQEWWGLAILLGGVVAVWGLPNDPPAGQPADPAVSERGAIDLGSALVVCVVLVLLVVLLTRI